MLTALIFDEETGDRVSTLVNCLESECFSLLPSGTRNTEIHREIKLNSQCIWNMSPALQKHLCS